MMVHVSWCTMLGGGVLVRGLTLYVRTHDQMSELFVLRSVVRPRTVCPSSVDRTYVCIRLVRYVHRVGRPVPVYGQILSTYKTVLTFLARYVST